MLLEGALEMRLVGEAGGEGDIGDQLALAQLGASELNALVDQEGMGCEPVILFEGADQVRRRQFGCQADVFQPQGWVQCSRMYSAARSSLWLTSRIGIGEGFSRCWTSVK